MDESSGNPWTLFESIPEMVVVVDQAGTIVYANAHSDLLGWPPAELVGRQIEVLVPARFHSMHETHRQGYSAHPKARPMGSGLLLTALHRSALEVPVEIALSPLSGEITATVATIRDVTDRLETSAQLLEARARLQVLDDRDRIARELHDSVIQRLFAAGLHLQASTGRPDTVERVSAVVDEIDEAIREIRGVIFTLQRPSQLDSGLPAALNVSINEAARLLGHRPSLRIGGMLGSVSNELSAELLTVLREALSNVAKHASATKTEVSLDVGTDMVTLIVADDGVGVPPTISAETGGLGLRNMHERAARLGGHATVTPIQPHGTEMRWVVPRPTGG